jgi:hypothetical protein
MWAFAERNLVMMYMVVLLYLLGPSVFIMGRVAAITVSPQGTLSLDFKSPAPKSR